MRVAEEIARLVRESYSDQALDELAGAAEDRTIVTESIGFVSAVADRAHQDEPFRSFRLINSVDPSPSTGTRWTRGRPGREPG